MSMSWIAAAIVVLVVVIVIGIILWVIRPRVTHSMLVSASLQALQTLQSQQKPSPPSSQVPLQNISFKPPQPAYLELSEMDVPGHDIAYYPQYANNIPALETVCNGIPECAGFNNAGHLKNSVEGAKTSGLNMYYRI
jgi:hypothetical protein